MKKIVLIIIVFIGSWSAIIAQNDSIQVDSFAYNVDSTIIEINFSYFDSILLNNYYLTDTLLQTFEEYKAINFGSILINAIDPVESSSTNQRIFCPTIIDDNFTKENFNDANSLSDGSWTYEVGRFRQATGANNDEEPGEIVYETPQKVDCKDFKIKMFSIPVACFNYGNVGTSAQLSNNFSDVTFENMPTFSCWNGSSLQPNYSLQLGNRVDGNQGVTETLTKSIVIAEVNQKLDFEYATVFGNTDNNDEATRPMFWIEVTLFGDSTESLIGTANNQVRYDLGYGINVPISNDLINEDNTNNLASIVESDGDIMYTTNWNCGVIDLSNLEIGTSIDIHFRNRRGIPESDDEFYLESCPPNVDKCYTYLDNFNNSYCENIVEPSIQITEASYNSCSCESEICIEYTLPSINSENGVEIQGGMYIYLTIYNDNNNILNIIRDTLPSDTNKYCYDLTQYSEIYEADFEGVDFSIWAHPVMYCDNGNNIFLEDIYLGKSIYYNPPLFGEPYGQDNVLNNDILFETCPIPTLELLGEDELCANENGLDATEQYEVLAFFDVNIVEDYADNFNLEVNINNQSWNTIPNYLDYIDEVGHFSYPVSYQILDCPIDCNTEFLKFTQYEFRMNYMLQDCFATNNVDSVQSEVITVIVYPPLRDEPYYTDSLCDRPNVPISYVRPCYKGTNGIINIDVDCIIGGVQNIPISDEKVCVETNFQLKSNIRNDFMLPSIKGIASITSLPENITVLTANDESYIKVEVIEHEQIGFDDFNLINSSATNYSFETEQINIPELELNPVSSHFRLDVTYHLVLSNNEIVEITESSGTKEVFYTSDLGVIIFNNFNETKGPKCIGLESIQHFNGNYTFNLYRDAILNNTWQEECKEFIGTINGATSGIASFNNDEVMHEGDYLIEVISNLGCQQEPYDTILVSIEQLDPFNTGFTKDVYYWCPDDPIDIVIDNYAGSEYLYTWLPNIGEINQGQEHIKTLYPYTCAGGLHTLTITRPGTTDGTQTCTIEDETFVVDFNPPPLELDRYEDAIGIGAAKYKSTWLNDFNDIQKNDPVDIQEIRDRNPYATGQAGVFRVYQSYDYLDDRRQFLARDNQETLIYNELETILNTDGVIGLPEDYQRSANDPIEKKTFTKSFAWNHPMLATCAPEWIFNSEITKYNPYNFETENKDILDRYSSALYGYGGKLTTAVAANADYHEIAFESFEEYALDGDLSIGTKGNITDLLPHPLNDNYKQSLTTFSKEGLATINISIDNGQFDCSQAPIYNSNFYSTPKVHVFIASPQENIFLNQVWTQEIDYTVTTGTVDIPAFTHSVNEGDKLYVAFSGIFSAATCPIEEDFITISWSVEPPSLFHQFNNTAGNFDFVTESKAGEREYLTPYNVIAGFGNYAIIDLPYSAVCKPDENGNGGNDKMVVKFAAESLEFDCGADNIIQEVVGAKTVVSLRPDPCEPLEEEANTMIIFNDEKAPGFAVDNHLQYWNGTIYQVEEREIEENVNNLEGISFTQSKAHTGKVSMQIDYVSDTPVDFIHPDLHLQAGKEYLVSAWIHSAEFENQSPIALRDHNLNNNIGLYITIGQMPAQFFAPAGNVIEGWQRLEGTIVIPPAGGDVTISFNPAETMWVDDIRLHPSNGGMQTYVYDLQRFRLQATLDHNNFATLYSYDDEGNLFHVAKETMDGTKTIQVSNAYIKPNTTP